MYCAHLTTNDYFSSLCVHDAYIKLLQPWIMQSMLSQEQEKEFNKKDICPLCNSTAFVFDSETSETLSSGCGMVIYDNIESLVPEWRNYTGEDMESKCRTGMPMSLALHDMGLSTFISYANMDANGAALSPEQRSKVQRMRRWNKISSNNRSYHRNLKNAFAILSSVKDKLSLNDALMEKSAYNYRKALDKRIIKGRSIRALVVASIYARLQRIQYS